MDQETTPLLQQEFQPEEEEKAHLGPETFRGLSAGPSNYGRDGQDSANQVAVAASSPFDSVPFKCWACWESFSTRRNPLIRVCRGCKDPELQYIHQECINSYITSLPVPRRPRSPRPRSQTLQEAMEDPAEEVLYDCTRCRDPYVVEEKLISPLYIIWDDLWLRFISIVLVLGFATMLATFCTIASNAAWGSDVVLVEIFGIPITVLFVALVLTILGMGAGIGLGATIWVASSGRKRLVVRGTPLDAP
ncbi:hypothetical protein HDV03_003052 [Kappamyces sp. JEL0829]|nr:hypothetical protein HDV03_003052 [Kappamyces sp. JEL0829]KAJ3371491.1 hypothetical protein HDU91_005133 [Kappamyces sp. JEL0680]